jgi:hypothetical protein
MSNQKPTNNGNKEHQENPNRNNPPKAPTREPSTSPLQPKHPNPAPRDPKIESNPTNRSGH